jgi:hypothetical protein
MQAFKVSLNGHKLCLAGTVGDGVLSAIVNSVRGNRGEDLFLEVGGLVSRADQHVRCINQKRLRVGDRIQIETIETGSADKPTKRYRFDRAKQIRSQKRYVRAMAKQFGWRIQTQFEK